MKNTMTVAKGIMRAMMSNPDSGVRGLKPGTYEADRVWLERTALDEARRILAVTEPAEVDTDWPAYRTLESLRQAHEAFPCSYYSAPRALAEALAAFCGEGK